MHLFYCQKHGQYTPLAFDSSGECPHCKLENLNDFFNQPYNKSFVITLPEEKTMTQRKYLPTLSELIDRLTIVQQKELKIPQNRETYTQELADIMHDIQLCIDQHRGFREDSPIDAETIRDIIVLTLMNCEIWHNESNFRKGIKEGNDLELTHGLNGIRNTAKNKIQEKFGGRKDYKVDNVEAFKDWVPSGYEGEKK